MKRKIEKRIKDDERKRNKKWRAQHACTHSTDIEEKYVPSIRLSECMAIGGYSLSVGLFLNGRKTRDRKCHEKIEGESVVEPALIIFREKDNQPELVFVFFFALVFCLSFFFFALFFILNNILFVYGKAL